MYVWIKWLILAKQHDIEVIVNGTDMLWLNGKHIEEKLDHKNLPATTNKYDQYTKSKRYELVNKQKKATKQKIFA